MRDPYDRYLASEDSRERESALDGIEDAVFDRNRYQKRKAAYLELFDTMRSQMTVDRAVLTFVRLVDAA